MTFLAYINKQEHLWWCALFGFDIFFSLSLSLHIQGATGPGTCNLDGEEDEGRGGHPRGSAHPG